MARTYRKRRRADLEARTRLRIVESLVELHGSIGPAQTTIRAVAERAGVQRATVYRHFPDEQSMYAACSAHWAAENPPPDPRAWSHLSDLRRRSDVALAELYGFYGRNEQMLSNVYRDESAVEALGPALAAFREFLKTAASVIVGDQEKTRRDWLVLKAAVGHAIAFSTWRSLVRDQRLSRESAVRLMTDLINQAAIAP